jgi:hypothetical protein
LGIAQAAFSASPGHQRFARLFGTERAFQSQGS